VFPVACHLGHSGPNGVFVKKKQERKPENVWAPMSEILDVTNQGIDRNIDKGDFKTGYTVDQACKRGGFCVGLSKR
jgi:hypothetical protein